MADRGSEFSFFRGIHVRLIKELISPFLYDHDHQIWQAGTSTGFDSNETNQAGAGDVIM